MIGLELSIMTDITTFGETALRLSPSGRERLARAEEMAVHASGTESTAAVAAAQLGAETVWLSKLPETPLGRRIVRELRGAGVETEIAWADRGRQGIRFSESAVAPRERRTIHDHENVAAATASPGEFPIGLVREPPVVFTALSTAVLSDQLTETTQALLRASADAVTAVGLDYTPGIASPSAYRETLEAVVDQTELLFANESGVRAVLDTDASGRELANTVVAAHDLDGIVLVGDSHGAVALQDGPGTSVVHERDPVPADTVDPAGADGAFVGAFLQRLVEGEDTAAALTAAVAAAALARTTPGPLLSTEPAELDRIADRVA